MPKPKRVTLRGVSAMVAARQEFDCNGTLRGVITLWPTSGRLNDEEWAKLSEDSTLARALNVPMYVVYSYATPIAWTRQDGSIYKVAQRFSVTTSKHWGKI